MTFNSCTDEICMRVGLNVCIIHSNTIYEYCKTWLYLHAFCITQFNYCPLIWMCHSHEKQNKQTNKKKKNKNTKQKKQNELKQQKTPSS